MRRFIHRPRRLAFVTAALFAAAGGIAYATVPDSANVFHACMLKATGTIRMVDPSATAPSLLRQPCSTTLETPISFNQQGPVGPAGPQGELGPPGAMVHAYRVNRGTQVEVTGIGTDVNGFPRDDSETTAVVSFSLPQGVFFVQSSVNVRKESGNGIFSCVFGDRASQVFTGIVRTSLGADAGHTRWASLAGPGFFNVPSGGATLTLECWQSSNLAIPGSPSGDNPIVIQANMNAIPVTRATITAFASGVVTEIP
jgi:hypothetical protein